MHVPTSISSCQARKNAVVDEARRVRHNKGRAATYKCMLNKILDTMMHFIIQQDPATEEFSVDYA